MAVFLTDKPSREEGKIHLHIQTSPETVRATRKLARATAIFVKASEDDAADIELAVGEALTNAYEHAYAGVPGPLDVDIAFDGGRFVIEVRDHGTPIAPPTIPTQSPRGARGRGLYIVQRIMDELKVVNPVAGRGGTVVRMAKRIG